MDMAQPQPHSPVHSPTAMSQTAQTATMEVQAYIPAHPNIATVLTTIATVLSMKIRSTPTPITETLTAMDMARPRPLSPAHSPMDMSQTAQTAMMEAPASIQAPQSIATE